MPPRPSGAPRSREAARRALILACWATTTLALLAADASAWWVAAAVVVGIGAQALTIVRDHASGRGLQSSAVLESKLAQLEERTRTISLLGRMSDRLQEGGVASDAREAVAEYGRKLFPHCAGALCTGSPPETSLNMVASWGEPSCALSFAPGDCSALRGQPSRGGDSSGSACRHVTHTEGASRGHLCVPVGAYRESFGVVCLDWPETPGDPDDPETAAFRRATAVAFADQVGIAIASRRLKDQLRAQALRDPLTELYNRRYLEEAFERELRRAARTASPLAVLMLDLDRFKEFNDTHGHAIGDELLCAFARELKRSVRASDVACRYGGEEFAVLLPDTDAEHAKRRAEQIREATRTLELAYGGVSIRGATVSIGVAVSPRHGVSADALLRAADAALYRAKAGGRDRIEAAP